MTESLCAQIKIPHDVQWISSEWMRGRPKPKWQGKHGGCTGNEEVIHGWEEKTPNRSALTNTWGMNKTSQVLSATAKSEIDRGQKERVSLRCVVVNCRVHSAHSIDTESGAKVKHSLLLLHRSRLTSTTFLRVLQPSALADTTHSSLHFPVPNPNFTAYARLWFWLHPGAIFRVTFQRTDHIQCSLELQALDETCN